MHTKEGLRKSINRLSFFLSIIMIIYFTFLTSLAFADRFSVSVPVANIRSGPGTKYDILWSVEKYHPLEITKKSGKWYKFKDFENDTGWIYKTLLGKTSAVITIKDKCNVRSGAGLKFDVVFTVDKGVPFKVLKRENGWINIQHFDGDKGWIHKSLVW